MKKLLMLITVLAACSVGGIFAFGRNRGCGYNKCATKACAQKCAPAPKCPKICETIVNEDPIPTQCCKRLVEVEDQPLLTKHVNISYECHCPQTCPIVGEKRFITEGTSKVQRTADYQKINGVATAGE